MLAGLAALSGACLAAAPAVQAPGAQEHTTAQPAAVPAPQGLPGVCLDAQSRDSLTKAFSARLREAIAASGALSLAPTIDSCKLQLHVPGNLLRFESAGAVMVSTVVIVTSPSGHYLSASITACRGDDLKPCATRAVAVAKLALLEAPNSGA
ncbi:MAG: hypothetical protein ACREU2_07305 [Steroidobacteraceae bacterium]